MRTVLVPFSIVSEQLKAGAEAGSNLDDESNLIAFHECYSASIFQY